MEEFIEPLKQQNKMSCLCFYSETQIEQNMSFGADADIYLDNKRWNSDACNINQWALYNSTADTYINIYKYLCYSISPIICLSKIFKWSKHNAMQSNADWEMKAKLLETNVPQKIIMIRFETHWFS